MNSRALAQPDEKARPGRGEVKSTLKGAAELKGGADVGGRPVKYTAEVVEAEAQALIDWFNGSEDRIFLCVFCAERGLAQEYMSRWARRSEVFAEALSLAKTIQKARLAGKLMDHTGSVSGIIFALKNVSGWRNGVKTEQKHPGSIGLRDIASMTPDEAKQRIAELNERLQAVEGRYKAPWGGKAG